MKTRLSGMTERDSYLASFDQWRRALLTLMAIRAAWFGPSAIADVPAPAWRSRDNGVSHKALLQGSKANKGTGHAASSVSPYRALREKLATQILDVMETCDIEEACPTLTVSEETGQILYADEPQSAVAARLGALVAQLNATRDADVSGLMSAYRVPQLANMVDPVSEDAIGSGRVTLAVDGGRWIANIGHGGASAQAVVDAIARRNIPDASLPNLPTTAAQRKASSRAVAVESETRDIVTLAQRNGWDADDVLAFYRLFHPMGKTPTAVRDACQTLSAIG